jgi:hypothetical protein
VFYVVEYVWVCGCVGVYTKSKTSELSPLRRKLLHFAKQFPPPLRSNNVLMNLSFMDFLFYVPFFCTAAAVTQILNICL